ncbi:methyl-accepting chemotaxis protein [uncultured Azohydromonas sp.]|uniref:methyl-accepting chemotaxis protein n=1 Tax=uncultured Azohydromonas sp. TaxID=487342 RepID=UPI00263A2B21|nr:methyl-accepting chemotaxis protein [uncultured Azohydromonas sp.]
MTKLFHWNIGARLALSFAGIVGLIAILAATAFIELGSAQDEIQELTGLQSQRQQLATEWRENVVLNSQRALAIFYSADKTLADRFGEDMKRVTVRTTEIQKRFTEIESAPEAVALMERLAKVRAQYLAERDALLKSPPAEPEALERSTQDFKATAQAYVEAATALTRYEQAHSAALSEDMDQKLATTRTRLVGAAVVCALLAGVLGWLLTHSIVRPLAAAQASAERIAGGDLTVELRAERRDEVGRLLQAIAGMQEALRHLVGDIRTSVDSIGTASAEVAAGNHDLSARTEETSASLQQTASSVEQISSNMRQSSDSASEADRLAREASSVAGQGGQAVLRVVTTMDAINQSSRRIGDIVGVIDGIAFQTNILALNAAVEAARAGEHGRGFAVVASEVRALAQRSATAAHEIKALIEDSLQRVEAGAREAQDAGRTIEGVVQSVHRVSEIVSRITTAASEQAEGIGEVNDAVAQLDQATQQNAALVEQSAAAASSLKDQALTLSRAVQRFRLA